MLLLLHDLSCRTYDIELIKIPDSDRCPVSIGISKTYPTIASGYSSADSNEVVLMRTKILTETLVLDRDLPVELKSGYGIDFAENAGWTTINGSMTIKGEGNVAVEKLIIK